MNKHRQVLSQIAVALLIFLITSQIIIIKGKEMPFPLQIPALCFLASPVNAIYSPDVNGKASLELHILQGFETGRLSIIINGDTVVKLNSDKVKIFVQTGDLIWFDARYVKEPIWVRVTESDIDSGLLLKGNKFRIFKEIIFLGEVSCFGRL